MFIELTVAAIVVVGSCAVLIVPAVVFHIYNERGTPVDKVRRKVKANDIKNKQREIEADTAEVERVLRKLSNGHSIVYSRTRSVARQLSTLGFHVTSGDYSETVWWVSLPEEDK